MMSGELEDRILELEGELRQTRKELGNALRLLDTYQDINHDFLMQEIDEDFTKNLENYVKKVLRRTGELLGLNVVSLVVRRQPGAVYTPGRFFDAKADHVTSFCGVGLTEEIDPIVQKIIEFQQTQYYKINLEAPAEMWHAWKTKKPFQSWHDTSPGSGLDMMLASSGTTPAEFIAGEDKEYEDAINNGYYSPKMELHVTPEELKTLYPSRESYTPEVCIPIIINGEVIAMITADSPAHHDKAAGTRPISEEKLADGEKLANLITFPLLVAAKTEELHYHKAMNQAVVQKVGSGIAIIGSDHKLCLVNPVLSGIIGDSVDMRIDEIEALAGIQPEIRDYMNGSGSKADWPHLSFQDKGREAIFDVSIAPISALHGPATDFLLTFNDVTEAVYRAQAESERRNREMTECVASGLGHTFNTPLGNIRLAATNDSKFVSRVLMKHPSVIELMRQDEYIAEELASLAESQTIVTEVGKLKDIISDLIRVLREGYTPIECRLSQAVTAFKDKYSQQWPQGQLYTKVNYDPMLYLDPSSFVNIVLMELAKNAQEEMKGSGRIDISTRQGELLKAQRERLREDFYDQSRCLVMEFMDYGPGMPPACASRAFNLGYSTKPEPEGENRTRGAGLYRLRKFITLSNGDVTLNTEEGKGATFRVMLPVINE